MTGHLLAIAAIVSVFTGVESAQTTWITYTSVEGRYSVSVPGQPQLSSAQIGSGSATFAQHTAQVSAPGTLYMLVWADPPIEDTPEDKQRYIEGARASLIKTINGTQLTAAPSVFGEQGLEFTASIPRQDGDRFVRVRTFFIGRRSYLLAMLTAANADRTENEKRYFDSFRITSR